MNRTGISKRDRGHSPRQLRPKLIYAKTQHIVANKCRVIDTVRVLGGEGFSSNGFMCGYQKVICYNFGACHICFVLVCQAHTEEKALLVNKQYQ